MTLLAIWRLRLSVWLRAYEMRAARLDQVRRLIWMARVKRDE